jgi:hypothetical protein
MIDRLLDGELSEKEEQALRAHMESCEDCRRVYDAYRAVSDALADDLAEPPEGLVPGVILRIDAGEAARKRARTRFGPRRIGLMAACLALMLFAGYQLDRWSGNHATSDSASTLQAPSEEYGVTSESAPKYAIAGAPAPTAAALPDMASGAGASDSSKGTERAVPAYSRVRIEAKGETLLDRADAQTIFAFTDSILLSEGAPEAAPDRTPDYDVILTAQYSGESLSYEIWVDGDVLRWRQGSEGEVSRSPASSSGFLALLSPS